MRLEIRKPNNTDINLEFEYNAEFITAIKAIIPAWSREYDPDTHIWTVLNFKSYFDELIDSARDCFDSILYDYVDNENNRVTENLKTGEKSITRSLF